MKRLLTTLVILTGLIGSGGAVWADAQSDFDKGYAADEAGDFTEAAKWYRKAAEQGDSKAQANLGRMYEEGRGVRTNFVKAEKYFRLAAAQGDPEGQVGLGFMHAKGINMAIDNVLAYMWFELAAGQDLRSTDVSRIEAAEVREFLALEMTPEQIAEAKKLAREWRPNSDPLAQLPADETSSRSETPKSEQSIRPTR